jgi:osmotically-inducible protein OsmY
VSELRDLLRIARAPGGEPVVVTDEVLAAGVQQRLDADPALRDSGIRVKSVDGGLVLLDGQAETLTAHLHALVLAREVRGVRRVASEIECPDSPAGGEIRREASRDGETSASSATSDARITERAKARLIANSITPAFDINVDTRAGVVTLFGTVPTAAARRLAELEVEQLDRVNGVENDLRIVPDVSEVNSERREQRLEDAIEKRLQARVGPGEKLRVERSAVPALDRLVGSDPVAVGSSRGRDDLCGESRDRGADAVSISCPSSAIERLAEPFAARPPQRLRRVLGFVEPSDAYSNR